MEAIICTQPDSPKFDSLPTYKITCYPLEQRDYKPFAQAQVCLTPGNLVVRLWAFEAHPRPLSMVEAVFTTRHSPGVLAITAWADGRWRCVLRTPSGERPLDAIAHAIAGEDLQGVYWGTSVSVSRRLAAQALEAGDLAPGSVLLGNFYKRSWDPEKPHHGSCWPADFAGGREYALSSLAPFRVARY